MAEIPRLTDDEWAEQLERLTLYCANKFRWLGWWDYRPGRKRVAPGGISGDEVALGAITSVIEGKRRYDPAKHPDFPKYLRSVADSHIYHLAHPAESSILHPMPVRADEDSQEPVEIEVASDDPDPAEVCINREVVDRIKASVLAVKDSDPQVVRLFECFDSEITKRSEIAELLDVDVKEIDKAKKRLRRNAENALAKDKEARR